MLEAELADIEQQFEGLLAGELPGINQALQAAGLPAIQGPPKVPASADAGISSANARWLATRKRADKKAMFHSLPQSTIELR